MPFVLDASVTACWAFDDEDHPVAARVLDRLRTDSAWAPTLWWFEVRNILVVNERRGRLTEQDTAVFLRTISSLPIAVDRAPREETTLYLARKHRLSVYDASYLELAKRDGLALATLDSDLARAARSEGMDLL
ncbi:MAG: type II toxin-antitoxin system VapC family toxin [Candidatus Eremiobacterota bacterium]